MSELGGTTRTRLRPHPLFLLVFAPAVFIGSGLLYAVLGIASWGAAPPAAVGVTIGMWWAMSLELSPSGVRMQRAHATWDQLELSRGPFGHRLRVRAEFAKKRNERIRLFLPMWGPNWRDGVIGDHMRRYAPHLLDQA